MNLIKLAVAALIIAIAIAGFSLSTSTDRQSVCTDLPPARQAGIDLALPGAKSAGEDTGGEGSSGSKRQPVEPLLPFVNHSLDWLAKAQFDNGGWGSGSNTSQGVSDPHAVQIDPATTAFSAMALMRSGNSLNSGPYSGNVRRALNYLLEEVEKHPEEGAQVTSVTGTQPQAKLGQNIDVSMCAQFFVRVLPDAAGDRELKRRVQGALNKCIGKLEKNQQSDGSWTDRGWAPVLQSAMANSALEMAQGAGLQVSQDVLDLSRNYQKQNMDDQGKVRTERAAGVELYSYSSNQRATAKEARVARERIDKAKDDGKLAADAEVNEENLRRSGLSSEKARELATGYKQNSSGLVSLQDEQVLAGFGNNGGEEFLSHMMTSESLVIAGGEGWGKWQRNMSQRFEKIQNGNGSWSGHHCITSPVFCTAAVILTLTADRDAELLARQ